MNARFIRTMALVLTVGLGVIPAVLASERTSPNATPHARQTPDTPSAVEAFDRSALAFEANRGQASPDVLYTAHSSDGTQVDQR